MKSSQFHIIINAYHFGKNLLDNCLIIIALRFQIKLDGILSFCN